MTELTLEQRAKLASDEIGEVLKKYDFDLAVNIEGAKPFIESLKPTLVPKGALEKNVE